VSGGRQLGAAQALREAQDLRQPMPTTAPLARKNGWIVSCYGKERTMKVERILVPVDYSACSRAALSAAVALAQKFGASLDVVHVWDRPSYVSNVVMTSTEPVSGKSLIAMIQENAQRDLDEFLKTSEVPSGVPMAARLIPGDPASALVHELRQKTHDLVVVGTHGRTGLSHLLLGSVAEKLVRLSPVPVLTVPDETSQQLKLA
jgi:nucleotide-binding universal stress UspA family protein